MQVSKRVRATDDPVMVRKSDLLAVIHLRYFSVSIPRHPLGHFGCTVSGAQVQARRLLGGAEGVVSLAQGVHKMEFATMQG